MPNRRSKASISFLFDAPPSRPVPPARHKHPPPSITKGRIRSRKPALDIRTVAVADRALLPPPDNDELVARYHRYLTGTASKFQRTYRASIDDRDDAVQDALLRLIRVKSEHRNHDRYVKRCLINSLISSYAKYRKVFDPLLSIDEEWDTRTSDEGEMGLLATLEAKDDALLDQMVASEFVTQALSSLSVEHRLVMSLYLGLGENSRPIENLRTLSKRSFVAAARLPAIIRSATAHLQRWHANR